MSRSLRNLATQGLTLGLAGFLLYFALRGVNWSDMGQAFQAAHWGWLIPIAFTVTFSHAVRAYRWVVFSRDLAPIDGRTLGLSDAFWITMMGYGANYIVPRSGEFLRGVRASQRTGLPFSALMGTIVAERVLDILCLGVLLLVVGAVEFERLEPLMALVSLPSVSKTTLLFAGVATLVISGGALHWGLSRMRDTESRVGALLLAFRSGLATVTHSSRPGAVWGSTLIMWIAYVVMTWLPFVMFGQTDLYGVGLYDGMVLMAIGALGIVIPSPGGVGSYHFIAIQSLVLLYAFSETDAAAYAIFSHGAQLVLYVALAVVGMLLVGLPRKDQTTNDA